MKYKSKKNKAFTLIELLVAMGIMVIVILFAGEIFKVSIESHRTAIANAEIMQKFRAIVNQLDSDFEGLDKNGEIFAVWKAFPVRNNVYVDNDIDGYERFDSIMFFTNGDFQSYKLFYNNVSGSHTNFIRGNTARICYTIAKNGTLRPEQLDKPKRILARTQHILTDDETIPANFDPNIFNAAQWIKWNNYYEYDKYSLEEWKKIPVRNKLDMFSFICDCDIKIISSGSLGSSIDKNIRGTSVIPGDPNSMHMLLCDGVGEFKIQGWDNTGKKWIPEVDPDGNGNLSDSNFFINDSNNVPGLLYPQPLGGVAINNISYPPELVNRENFNSIPGLGRALKFSFTLFDSRGIIKGGRAFTYIVYLDN